MNRQSTEDIQDSETILCDIIMVTHAIVHLSKCIDCITPRVKPDRNYELATCLCGFIICNQYPILVQDVRVEEAVGGGGIFRGNMETLNTIP